MLFRLSLVRQPMFLGVLGCGVLAIGCTKSRSNSSNSSDPSTVNVPVQVKMSKGGLSLFGLRLFADDLTISSYVLGKECAADGSTFVYDGTPIANAANVTLNIGAKCRVALREIVSAGSTVSFVQNGLGFSLGTKEFSRDSQSSLTIQNLKQIGDASDGSQERVTRDSGVAFELREVSSSAAVAFKNKTNVALDIAGYAAPAFQVDDVELTSFTAATKNAEFRISLRCLANSPAMTETLSCDGQQLRDLKIALLGVSPELVNAGSGLQWQDSHNKFTSIEANGINTDSSTFLPVTSLALPYPITISDGRASLTYRTTYDIEQTANANFFVLQRAGDSSHTQPSYRFFTTQFSDDLPSVATATAMPTPKCNYELAGMWRGRNRWGVAKLETTKDCIVSFTDNGENPYFTHSALGTMAAGNYIGDSPPLNYVITRTNRTTGCVTKLTARIDHHDSTPRESPLPPLRSFVQTITGSDGACDLPIPYMEETYFYEDEATTPAATTGFTVELAQEGGSGVSTLPMQCVSGNETSPSLEDQFRITIDFRSSPPTLFDSRTNRIMVGTAGQYKITYYVETSQANTPSAPTAKLVAMVQKESESGGGKSALVREEEVATSRVFSGSTVVSLGASDSIKLTVATDDCNTPVRAQNARLKVEWVP